jgi:hypothetical protein
MQESAVGSFMRFSIGFLTFIFLSIGITVAVNVYANAQATQQQTASALQAMLKVQK